MREAGRDLDALVAEKVMRRHVPALDEMEAVARQVWKVQPSAVYFNDLGGFSAWMRDGLCHAEARIPPYSTNIAAAWEVVERLRNRFHARITTPFTAGEQFFCGFTPLGITGWNGRPDFSAGAETAPLAICLAALKAMEALPDA